jgi:predicted transglutaminase-like cysteine proteinase
MLTETEFTKVKETFAYVHSIFEYVDDQTWYGHPERWEDPKYIAQQIEAGAIKGDCDNFALACRYILNQARVPNRIAMCVTETGEGHLVCEAEGWILDNRQTRVRSWGELPYQWIKISGYKPGQPWHEITA